MFTIDLNASRDRLLYEPETNDLVDFFKSVSDRQEGVCWHWAKARKSFKKNICGCGRGQAVQDWGVGKALLNLGRCCYDLASEILTFLGTDGMLNPQLKKLTESETLVLIPNQAPKFSGPFCKYCSGWLLYGSSSSQPQNFKSAPQPLFASVLLVLRYRPYHPAPRSITLSSGCCQRAQPHWFRGGTCQLRLWGQLCKDV